MLGGGNLVEVLITALGNEIGLGDDGDGEIGQVGQAVRGHDGGVFDAVARVGAGIAQRRDRHQQLGGGDAVDGDRAAVAVPLRDPAGKLLEVQVVVVQDPFARRQAVHVLAKIAMPVQLFEPDDVGDAEIRCGVGDSGDAVAAEPTARESARLVSLRVNASDQESALRSLPSGWSVRPMRARPAELRIHSTPLRCWTRSGVAEADAASKASRSSGPATESW